MERVNVEEGSTVRAADCARFGEGALFGFGGCKYQRGREEECERETE